METEGGNPNPIPNRETESTAFVGPMGFFWDLDGGKPAGDLLWGVWDSLRKRPFDDRPAPVAVFNTYVTVKDEDPVNELEEATLVNFYCCERKDRYHLIMFDVLSFIIDEPPPGTILFISGNPEFAHLLRKLKGKGYNMIVIGSSKDASSAFRDAGLILYDWGPVIRGEGFFPLERGFSCSKKRDYASFSKEA